MLTEIDTGIGTGSPQPDISATPDHRPTHVLITVRIPSDYHQEPVISQLISKYGLTVNITAAILGESVEQEGWFKLELRGLADRIQSALQYLNELDLEVWRNSAEEEGW